MPEIAFLNGEFMPIEEAKVPVDDRGYQFGDGVYEVIESYKGRLWALERHLNRLRRSLSEIGISGITVDEIRERILEIHKKSGISRALVYVQVTRGVAPRRHAWMEGYITEGAHNNIFAVRDGRLFTPQEGPHILSGITRGLVIEMAKEEGIPVEEGPLSYEALLEADEVFLTGTGVEVLGVVSVDGRRIGSGEVGPMTRRLYEMFMDRVERGMDSP